MKKLSILFAGLIAFTVSVQAQISTYQSVSLPATLGNGTTNLASPVTIGAIKQQNVAFSVTLTGTAGGTNTYTFNRSVDGNYYDTNAANVITFVAGTSAGQQVTTTTNISASGFGYLKLVTIATVSSGTITNNSASYSVKIGAP